MNLIFHSFNTGCPKYLTREGNKRKPPMDRSNVLPKIKKRKTNDETTTNETVLIDLNEAVIEGIHVS